MRVSTMKVTLTYGAHDVCVENVPDARRVEPAPPLNVR
jgi:hypothetical protein